MGLVLHGDEDGGDAFDHLGEDGLGVAKLNRNDPAPPVPKAGPSTTVLCARSVTSAPGESGRSMAVQSSQAR